MPMDAIISEQLLWKKRVERELIILEQPAKPYTLPAFFAEVAVKGDFGEEHGGWAYGYGGESGKSTGWLGKDALPPIGMRRDGKRAQTLHSAYPVSRAHLIMGAGGLVPGMNLPSEREPVAPAAPVGGKAGPPAHLGASTRAVPGAACRRVGAETWRTSYAELLAPPGQVGGRGSEHQGPPAQRRAGGQGGAAQRAHTRQGREGAQSVPPGPVRRSGEWQGWVRPVGGAADWAAHNRRMRAFAAATAHLRAPRAAAPARAPAARGAAYFHPTLRLTQLVVVPAAAPAARRPRAQRPALPGALPPELARAPLPSGQRAGRPEGPSWAAASFARGQWPALEDRRIPASLAAPAALSAALLAAVAPAAAAPAAS